MNTIPKAKIRSLNTDQQEAVADIELRLFRNRQQLISRAKSYTGLVVFPSMLFLVVIGLLIFNIGYQIVFIFCIFASIVLVQFHAFGLNRRLDALCNLLEVDITHANKTQKPTDVRDA